MSDQNHALVAIQNKLGEIAPRIAEIIPPGTGTNKDRMISVALGEIRRNPKLLSCSPASFCDALMQAARFGIEPGGPMPLAYLIPYGKDCKLMFDYKGLIKVVRRNPQVKNLYAKVVYEDDFFEVSEGSSQEIVHKRTFKSEKPVCYYAVAVLADDEITCEVMTKSQMDEHRKTYVSRSDAWDKAYDEMAKKTVLRRLMKTLPLSDEAKDAYDYDSEVFAKRVEPKTYQQVIDADDAPSADQDKTLRLDLVAALERAQKAGIDTSDILPTSHVEDCVTNGDIKDVVAATEVINKRLAEAKK